MSISAAGRPLNKHLAKLMSAALCRRAAAGEKVLGNSRGAPRAREGMVTPGTMFEEFGFNLHRSDRRPRSRRADPTLKNISELQGPQFLHVVTRKARATARGADPVLYHGVSKFKPTRHRQRQERRQTDLHPGIRRLLCDMASGPTPDRHHTAMREGSGLVPFRDLSERYFDVGIAEQTR